MHNDSASVHQDPARIGVPFDGQGTATTLFDRLNYGVGDCFQLTHTLATADHEIVSNERDFVQIKQHNVRRFLVNSGIYDDMG